MSKSLLNRQYVKQELSKGEGIQTVSKEAIDWVDAATRELVLKLAKYGWRTPGGRLKAPKMDPALASSQAAGENWTEYHDWQLAVRKGETRLPFEEWRKQHD